MYVFCMYVYVCVCMYVCMRFLYVCICMCMYDERHMFHIPAEMAARMQGECPEMPSLSDTDYRVYGVPRVITYASRDRMSGLSVGGKIA